MLVLILSCGLLLAGTTSTMTAKGADRREFNHPHVQVLFMFVGEALCLLLAPFAQSGDKRFDMAVYETSISKWRFAIPAFLDFLGSTLIFLGIQRTTAAQFQLMRSSLVPFTCAVSFFLLGRAPFRYELVGVGFVVIGVALVSLVRDSGPAEHSNQEEVFGNMLVVLAQFVLSFQLVWEEKVYREQKVNTLTAVGVEGKR
jgi:drug/metabolite transporter (DMT)-like permease